MMNYSRSMKRHSKNILIITVLILILMIVISALLGMGTSSSGIDRNDETTIEATVQPSPAPSIEQTTMEVRKPEIISLGEYRLTAYCGCSKCCGKWGENRPLDENGKPIVYTANQSIAKEGVTIAADINILPYGTKVIIDGHEYIVQDKGGVINGNRIDIYFESHQDALNFGVQYKEIYIERNELND